MNDLKRMPVSFGPRLSRRSFNRGLTALSLGVAGGTLLSGQALARTDPLVFTWAGWDPPELHQSYIDEYGSQPLFSFYADSQEAFTKVRAGFSADIFEVGVTHMRWWYDAGLVQPIDPTRLKHWNDFYEPMRKLDGQWFDDELYYIPTMYGGVSILYRSDLVEVEEESWAMLWDERYAGKIAPIDFPAENVVQVGVGLGMPDPWNMSDEELKEVRKVLEKQAKLAKFYWNNPTMAEQGLVSGEIVISAAWSEMAPRVTNLDVPIVYANPKEGRLATQDGLTISAKPEVELDRIYAYIDARTSPETGAYCMTNFGMVNPNRKAVEIAPPEVVKSMGADNIDETMRTARSWKTMTPEREEKYISLSLEVRANL